jgi:hypothetical protein
MDFLPDDYRAIRRIPVKTPHFPSQRPSLPKRLAETSATELNSSTILDPKRFKFFQIPMTLRIPTHCCDAAKTLSASQKFRCLTSQKPTTQG